MDRFSWNFFFLVAVAESGGFKSSARDDTVFYIFYIGIVWLTNFCAQQYQIAKILLTFISIIAIVASLFINIIVFLKGGIIIVSGLLFFIFNVGIFLLACKNDSI